MVMIHLDAQHRTRNSFLCLQSTFISKQIKWEEWEHFYWKYLKFCSSTLIISLTQINSYKNSKKKKKKSLGWCGSVDWTWACKPKGCWCDSQSGHMPGLQARSPVEGAWEATTHWCFSSSLFPSFPLSLKINKMKSLTTTKKISQQNKTFLLTVVETPQLRHRRPPFLKWSKIFSNILTPQMPRSPCP